MNDSIYWTARVALVLGWLAVAWASLPLRARQRAFTAVAVAALLFATMRALRWNYSLLLGARELLQATGVNDDRVVGKLIVGALLVAAAALAIVALRRLGDRALRMALLGVGLQAALVLVETCSFDDVMPRWLLAQPGRYLAEGSFLALAALGVRAARRSSEAKP
ncbi:MAG: hypothetical protein FJ301_06855 [Planctomycetes bacterium]|nr:hypothetical protein [Planctomycetota bacterium]